ncbi:MAG: FAD-dependent oxidoreductase [Pseudomonadales bacterium]
MSREVPTEANILIIGGGIVGCSIAYHLAKRGVNDVVLLEREQLTCGTTWHAAGLCSMLWPTPTLTRLAQYSHELYASLEAETEQATGYRKIGSLSLARDAERLEELRRTSSMGKVFGVESEWLDNKRLEELYPGINTEGVIGSMYIANDGQTNPIDTTMALAKGAKQNGAMILEGYKVDKILTDNGKAVGVNYTNKKDKQQGSIKARHVVLCGGLWSRDIAAKIGVDLPLYACEHQYVVTPEMPTLTKRPVLRDFSKGLYFKEDAGKMLVGWFETNAIGCSMKNIREEFSFDEFPCDMDHIEPYLMGAMETFPEFGEAGIRTYFNGPESFTNDNLHLLGPTPEVDNFWVACGMNSKGIGAGGGVGKIMADWIVDGYPSGEITETDVNRNNSVQRTQNYVEDRIPEALGHTYSMHWPFYQYHTARNLIHSPIHEQLKEQGACFGEVGGFERANWFAKPGQKAEYEYSYKRQNWFQNYADEHKAMRDSVGVYDISSFGKFEVSGPGAMSTLQNLSCANMDVEVGKVIYTQWLNERGGIEADLTVSKTGEDKYAVVTGIGSLYRDWWRLKKHLHADTELTDFTTSTACFSVQGPNARNTLQKLTDEDLSHEAFPFGTGRFVKLGGADMWMQRISYVGELGWEIFVPEQYAVNLFNALHQVGEEFNIRNVGLHALNSLRLEKGFRHWGHDVAAEDNLVQAGLSFTAKPDISDFIGRQAFVDAKAAGLPDRRLIQFKLDNPEPLLYHNEPIIMNGDVVGYLSSGMYGHTLGAAIGMGYVNSPGLSKDALADAEFQIEVACERFTAQASLGAQYDPKGLRTKM